MMKTVIHGQLELLATDIKQALQAVYGDRLAGLILYGSYARNDFHAESDVDFAVVLKDPAMRTTAEIFRLAPITADLSLKYGIPISTLPVSEQKLNTSRQGVYEAIRNEGVRL